MKTQKQTELRSFSTRLPSRIIEQLKLRALRRHTSVQALTMEAFRAYLKQEGGK